MKKELLVIERDGNAALTSALREVGYVCSQATSVQQALPIAESGGFGLAVMDATPCEAFAPENIPMLHARGHFPVLVISPASGGDRLVEMLNAGAEDYLTRPFELRELVERIEIQLKRGARPGGPLRHRDLLLDPDTFSVTLRGQPVALTKQEFRILELLLLASPGRVFSKQDIFDYAWDYGYVGVDKTVNVHICNIRKKFRAITGDPYIETIWGLGFRLV